MMEGEHVGQRAVDRGDAAHQRVDFRPAPLLATVAAGDGQTQQTGLAQQGLFLGGMAATGIALDRSGLDARQQGFQLQTHG
ncbi:hypothetical protein D3C78_1875210 [compost metagenome]